MKLSLLTLAAAVGLASSQCVSSIPECARSCLMIAAGSVGCGETDYSCQCTQTNQQDITNNATTCVLAACGEQTALNEVLPAASAFCSAINAGESCSSASAGSTGSTSGTSAPSSTPDTTPSTTGSMTGSMTSSGTGSSATTETSSTASSTATTTESSGTGTGTGTGTATGASASASSTAGAAAMGSVGSLGIAVLGALVML